MQYSSRESVVLIASVEEIHVLRGNLLLISASTQFIVNVTVVDHQEATWSEHLSMVKRVHWYLLENQTVR